MPSFLVSPEILLSLITALAGLAAQTPEPAAVDLKPITVAMVDRDSGAPVTDFTYQASYDSPGGATAPNGDVWTQVKSPAGTFEIQRGPRAGSSSRRRRPTSSAAIQGTSRL